ncbi:MAG TPA: ribonuclease Y [Fimbriimonadaceae bacterium]|nr:ribonuclease Y [Fimbriimonadaceae bacterium]
MALFFAWVRPAMAAARREKEQAAAVLARMDQEAESRLKEAMLQAKESALAFREQAEEELRQKRQALAKVEEKLAARDETIEQRRQQIEAREMEVRRCLQEAEDMQAALKERELRLEHELARAAELGREEARELYLERVESEFRELGLRRAMEIEASAVADAEKRARKVVLDAMHRCAVEYVTEATVAVVELPSEDMKGRIIGREGRNIRAFEQVTGVDLIIDETPEAVVISCFDPVRRETARLTLMNLMLDGRIHPGRIEELYEKAQVEVQRMVRESGERAAERAEVVGLPPKVIDTLGKLRFRTSYAQNVLDHSVEVAHLSAGIAGELGVNVEVSRRAGLLHDIGKALGPEWEGPHAISGMEFLRTHGEKESVLHAVGAHHYEIEPQTPEAMIVIVADALSAARPGARRESLENYLKRLTALEQLANSFAGVERSYAVQAGREIRLIVKPQQIDDLGAIRLAGDVAKKIESELDYPGQIKVTVIRETRAQGVAN